MNDTLNEINYFVLKAATKRKEDSEDNSFTNQDGDHTDENDEDGVCGGGEQDDDENGAVSNRDNNNNTNNNNDEDVDCDDGDCDDDYMMMSGDDNHSMSSPNPSRKSLHLLNDSQFNMLGIAHQPHQQQHQQQLMLSSSSSSSPHNAKKPRLVFTDIQRRTLQAIFKETKRPSKEMQVTIAQQLGLEVATVSNFFMNARRRSMDKWKDQDDENSNSSCNTK